ncbi:MAG: DUF1553 domain-containing protein [Lewinellaceae bacterium]|nr:DUF1553 domain-containing protein [Lewinellaceae bacterium]
MEQLFGFGLVETLEDLGSRVPCSHPALLEYLSWQFIHDDAWSMKKLLRTIVLSLPTGRIHTSANLRLAADPKNKYLARGPRLRLTAEQIRDQALARCGVLTRKCTVLRSCLTNPTASGTHLTAV